MQSIEQRSFALVRFIGYGMLAFSVIDYIAIIVPLRLTEPVWEVQTIAQLVEHIWAPLLGFAFVFFSQNEYLGRIEIKLLKFLSWTSLILGIAYFLILPLDINDNISINVMTSANINHQVNQRINSVETLKQEVSQGNTSNTVKFLANIGEISAKEDNNSNKSPNQLHKKLEAVTQNLSTSAEKTRQEQSKKLLKESLRINLTAIVGGACFITVWRLTKWVRVLKG